MKDLRLTRSSPPTHTESRADAGIAPGARSKPLETPSPECPRARALGGSSRRGSQRALGGLSSRGFLQQGKPLETPTPEPLPTARRHDLLPICSPRTPPVRQLLDRACCEDRIGTGPPRERAEVIYVDLGYRAISGSVHSKGDPRSWGIKSSVFRGAAVQRRGGESKGCKDIHAKNGSSRGQSLALTGLFVPISLDRGHAAHLHSCELR